MAKPKHECNPPADQSLLLAMRDTIHPFSPRSLVSPVEFKQHNRLSGVVINLYAYSICF